MSDEVLVGKLVAGRYRVARRLGGGGMGTVYVAIQEPLGREVALKVVRRELSGEKRTVERFRREAMSLSQAHHPHIVTLYDFGELPTGALWFAMELVRGEDLRQRLNRGGPIPVKKTVAIIRDAASGLAAAHALGIIHRDLKPENILLMEAAGRPDFVKLVDFGVAKLPIDVDADPAEQHLTMRGTVVGTPGYIAPEVALKDVTNDPRSDLYALGVVWFECLAGRPPFAAKTATGLLMMHALEPVPALPDEVPLPIAGLVQRLLAKNADDRPATAELLVDALDALPLFDTGAAVPRPTRVPALADPSAATIDDSGLKPRPSAPTIVPAPPPTPHTVTSAALLTEAALTDAAVTDAAVTKAALPKAALAKAALAKAALAKAALTEAAFTERTLQPALPTAVEANRWRTPLLVLGAGLSIGTGAFIGAYSLRHDAPVAGVVDVSDAGASRVIDAGVRDASVRDAGVRDAGVRDAVVRDAVVRDAGAVDAVDAGPKKRVRPPRPKRDAGGEHVPDLD